MSLYRLEVRIIGRSAGQHADGARAYRGGSAVAAGAYRRGARTTAVTGGESRVLDYSKKRGVILTETLAPADAPAWATNSEHLWQMVEMTEKRKDSQLARELLFTLPHDVPLSMSLEAHREWLQRETVALGMVADLAVHGYGTALDPKKPRQAARIAELRREGVPIRPLAPGDLLRDMPPDGPHAWELPDGKVLVYQPHAHVLLTMRDLGPEGFGRKRRDWNTKAQIHRWRQSWEQTYNELLAAAGSAERVCAKARWKREADEQKGLEVTPGEGASPMILRRQLDLGGGHYAALDGRPATQNYGDMPVTAFDWNETERDLRRREEAANEKAHAAEKKVAAATRDREALVKALTRMVELTSLGVEFLPRENGRIRVRGSTRHITEQDKLLIEQQRPVLLPLLRAAPHLAPAPKLDQRLQAVMERIDRLQEENGVRFFPTPNGTLGYEPEGAISPEVYNTFSGLHGPILVELDRREKVGLWQEAERQLAARTRQLEIADQDRDELRSSLENERRSRATLEQGTEAIIAAADAGTSLPEAPAGSRLLQRLRATFEKVRQNALKEKMRADRLQKALAWLKASYVNFVDFMAKRHPEAKTELEEEKVRIMSGVAQLEQPPGNRASTERFKVKPKVSQEESRPEPAGDRITPPRRSRDHGAASPPTGQAEKQGKGKGASR